MIPVDAMLEAWRETKLDRCTNLDTDMGRDLLPQVHLVLSDGRQAMVMCDDRIIIPAIPMILGLDLPVASATFMADSWHRTSDSMAEAETIHQGDLGRAFKRGDPDVSEALVLHSVGALSAETVIQPYVIKHGVPVWGEVVRIPAVESEGAIPDLLRAMIRNSQSSHNPGRN